MGKRQRESKQADEPTAKDIAVAKEYDLKDDLEGVKPKDMTTVEELRGRPNPDVEGARKWLASIESTEKPTQEGKAAPSEEDLKTTENLDSIVATSPDSTTGLSPTDVGAELEQIGQYKQEEEAPASSAEELKKGMEEDYQKFHIFNPDGSNARIEEPDIDEKGIRELQELADARADDPRVTKIAPSDSHLILDEFNVRHRHNDWDIQQLHKSISEEGQRKPVIVTPRGEELWVVTGNTRVLATRYTEAVHRDGKVPEPAIEELAIIKVDLTDKQAWILSILSNQDNNLPVAKLEEDDRAKAIEKLIDDYKWTQQRVASFTGMNQGTVSRLYRLRKVDSYVESLIKHKNISESAAEIIMTLPREYQRNLSIKVSNAKYTVKQVQQAANNIKYILEETKELKDFEITSSGTYQYGLLNVQTQLIERCDAWTKPNTQSIVAAAKAAVKEGGDLPNAALESVIWQVLDNHIGKDEVSAIIKDFRQLQSEITSVPGMLHGSFYKEVASGKLPVETAVKRIKSIQAFYQQIPTGTAGYDDYNLKFFIRDRVQKVGEESAREMGQAVKALLEKGKATWELESFFKNKDWKDKLAAEEKKLDKEAAKASKRKKLERQKARILREEQARREQEAAAGSTSVEGESEEEEAEKTDVEDITGEDGKRHLKLTCPECLTHLAIDMDTMYAFLDPEKEEETNSS